MKRIVESLLVKVLDLIILAVIFAVFIIIVVSAGG